MSSRPPIPPLGGLFSFLFFVVRKFLAFLLSRSTPTPSGMLAGSRRGPVRAALAMCVGSSALGSGALNERSVETAHSFTGRMCAASRLEETRRPDSLFSDPLAYTLAGKEGRAQPMGGWIMVPRTRFGDDFLRDHYTRGARQLVLLGAGFDARAYRMSGLPELRVYEVDQKTTFEVKEPLLTGGPHSQVMRRTLGWTARPFMPQVSRSQWRLAPPSPPSSPDRASGRRRCWRPDSIPRCRRPIREPPRAASLHGCCCEQAPYTPSRASAV